MTTKPKNSEEQILEKYRVSLVNTETQPQIATEMSDHGYGAEEVGVGKSLLDETTAALNFNVTEDDETSETSNLFKVKKKDLIALYVKHRKKAKIIFRKDHVTADKLGISGEMPRVYVSIVGKAKKFYSVALSDSDIQAKLPRLKITKADLEAGQTLIAETEHARSEYLREVGESQDATKAKDAAFAKLDDWMSEFYAVARIALEDHPQLLEALGIIVKG